MTWTVHTGDCREVMATLPASSVDTVITDPPYGTGQWKRAAAGAGSNCKAVHSVETWDTWDLGWMDQARRVCRGTILVFCPTTRLGDLLAKGRRMLLWVKPDARPRFGGQLAFGCEPIVVIGAMQKHCGPDWYMATSPRLNRDAEAVGHPHQKPVDVMRWLVRVGAPPRGVVLDQFAGSGSTGVAALIEGRSFIGIEQSAAYCDVARKRIAAGDPIGRQETIVL